MKPLIQACASDWRLTCSLALLALATSCSEELPKTPAVFQRLELVASGNAIVRPETRLVKRWNAVEAGAINPEWQIEGPDAKVRKFEEKDALTFGREKGNVVLRLPLDLKLDYRLAVNLKAMNSGQGSNITVSLLSGENKVARLTKLFDAGKKLRSQIFQLGEPWNYSGKIDALQIEIEKNDKPLVINSLTLMELPVGVGTGSASFSGFELAVIGGDARRVTALPSGSEYRATVKVSGKWDVLRFTYGQPNAFLAPHLGAELRVKLKAEGSAPIESTFDLEAGFDEDNKWKQGKISLADFEGREVEVVFDLISPKGPAVCALGEVRRCVREAQPRTVLLVTSDTHRSDHMGFLMEEGKLRTDAIDELASQGLVFMDAVTSVNNTTPSHASLMTGMSPRDTGLVANGKRLADEANTLAEAFRERGYATLASVSSSPVNYNFSNLGQGFDRFSIPVKGSIQEAEPTIDCMTSWLEDYEGTPLFLWVHVVDAHGPYDPPDEYKRTYYALDKDPFDPEGAGADPSVSPYWDKTIADPDYTEGLYKGEITYLDEHLGRLFEVERIDQGITVFTSDHGEVLRHGLDEAFNHQGLSLNTLAVPLIFKAPGIVPGERREDPVLQIDIGRTLLNLAGLQDVEFPGRDLINTSTDLDEPRFAIQANGFSASVLTDKWMLDLNLRLHPREGDSLSPPLHSVLLYDIRTDKFCQFNVMEENFSKAQSLRRLLIRWLERAKNNKWQADDLLDSKVITEHLADLGYVSVEDSGESDWFDSTCECNSCSKFAE
ncbi:MAG: arylsulfatase A-like enzyme [Planctomycetota bacterium]|jgi:arylsulfatase A-like enzyme